MNRPAAIAIMCAGIGLADLVWIDAWLLPAWAGESSTTAVPAAMVAAATLVLPPPDAPIVTRTEEPAAIGNAPPPPAPKRMAAAEPEPELEIEIVERQQASTPARQRTPVYFPRTGTAELSADGRASLVALAS